MYEMLLMYSYAGDQVYEMLLMRTCAGDQPTERPRPVTAYQRQKEREDARLRKLEKAREKSKKKSTHLLLLLHLLCFANIRFI